METSEQKQLNESVSGNTDPNPDHLNAIGVLTRREIEARILAPLLEAMGEEFGRERVMEITREVIVGLSHQQGVQLADRMGGGSLDQFAAALEDWKKGDAIELQILEQNQSTFAFNITRCRYAELYHQLGIPELGVMLSCNRDFALIEGFNPAIKLTRTQTIMQGASHCDFRYQLKE